VSKRVRDRDKRPIKDHAKENIRYLNLERMTAKLTMMDLNRTRQLGKERYNKSNIKAITQVSFVLLNLLDGHCSILF